LGRLQKRQSNHDLIQVIGSVWRANMILMDDKQTGHQSLLKINRRVFSADYVPLEYFTPQWLYQNSMDELQYEPAIKFPVEPAQKTSQETSKQTPQEINLNEVVDQ
jgi:hypothetical protein